MVCPKNAKRGKARALPLLLRQRYAFLPVMPKRAALCHGLAKAQARTIGGLQNESRVGWLVCK